MFLQAVLDLQMYEKTLDLFEDEPSTSVYCTILYLLFNLYEFILFKHGDLIYSKKIILMEPANDCTLKNAMHHHFDWFINSYMLSGKKKIHNSNN